MGKVQNFYILYENRLNNVYFSGQTLFGRVFLEINEPIKMRALRVKVDGRAHTQWIEGFGRVLIDYYGNEQFIDNVITLWGKQEGQSGDDPVMQPGSYEFSFSCPIPMNCPSSFEGGPGYIRYLCKAIIDRPWHSDIDCSVPFTVVGTADLNHNSLASTPIEDTMSKTLGFMCCKSGTIECIVRIPRGGFVPGELIPLNVEILNKSSTNVEKVTANFVQYVAYKATHGLMERTTLKQNIIASLQQGAISPGDSQIWAGIIILIPPIAPSLKTCSIIDASYQLQIIVNPSDGYESFVMRVPILIGNIPLRSVYQNFAHKTNRQRLPLLPPNSIDPCAPPPAYSKYPDLPPPTYEETVLGGDDIQAEDEQACGSTRFLPRYPYYRYLSKEATRKS